VRLAGLVAPFILWTAWAFAHGERRWEHAAFFVGVPVLAYATERTRRFFVLMWPLGLVGLLYDTMRFVKDVGLSPGRVHTCDLEALDRRLTFGAGDFIRAHTSPVLDAICAVPYGTFIVVVSAYGAYLFFKDERGLERLAWTFLVLNVAGFLTYHLYPAAPPWYVHQHGCAVDLAAHASEGARLARVDAAIGYPFFAGFYARSNDVFGAVPSLHVAYPTILLFEAWRRHGVLGRTLAALFLATMGYAAIYLDHHWIVDLVLGMLYAAGAYVLVLAWQRRAIGRTRSTGERHCR
jgi:membrane-associated phospholipid phosphatase